MSKMIENPSDQFGGYLHDVMIAVQDGQNLKFLPDQRIEMAKIAVELMKIDQIQHFGLGDLQLDIHSRNHNC